MIAEDFPQRIEIFATNKEELEAAEKVLKESNIEYKIVPSKTHTSRLKRLTFEKPLATIHDILTSLDFESKRYAEKLKKDFEVRKYWRKQFQKFQEFNKKN